MKFGVAALLIAASFLAMSPVNPAFANADDAAWIKRCVNDNKREGATPEVVAAYCSCYERQDVDKRDTVGHRLGKDASG